MYAYLSHKGSHPKRITCVGHSLGAHICGMMANHLSTKQHKIIGSCIWVNGLMQTGKDQNSIFIPLIFRPRSCAASGGELGTGNVSPHPRRCRRGAGHSDECRCFGSAFTVGIAEFLCERRTRSAVLQGPQHS